MTPIYLAVALLVLVFVFIGVALVRPDRAGFRTYSAGSLDESHRVPQTAWRLAPAASLKEDNLMVRSIMALMLIPVLVMTSGCATTGDGDKTLKGGAIGTVAGAALGAALGAATGNPARGAWIGAAAGAAAGTATGVTLDAQEEKLRQLGIETRRLSDRQLLVQLTGDDLHFDFDQATIRPGDQARLQQVASVLRDYPEHRIIVAGHTDGTGSDTYNEALSQRRAQSVSTFLIHAGVPATSFTGLQGYGERQPIAPNSTPDGRAQNRRVELTITAP